MRLRRLALAVGLASAFGTNLTNALGLGEIKLNSNLNQPLEAEIKLLQVRDLSENEILVSLASKDEFQRAGIDRLFLLTDLKFEVSLDAPSGPVIRVTTRNPVREPYLNFLLESQWPNGRILREYTVLLDLPVFSEELAKPIQSTSTSTSTSAAKPARASVPRTSGQASGSQPASAAGGVYGPVSAADTLWDIALKVRPNRQYSVHKTMLALQRLNPEAFINGNINMLRRGQVLRIPQAAEIDALSQQQALNEVAFQNNQWVGDQQEQPQGAQIDATGNRGQAPLPRQRVEGRIKVAADQLTPDSQQERGAGSGSSRVGGSPDTLQKDLAVSLEELDRSRRENSDLQSRVRALEEQIKTMERLVEVSSQELRALQLQSGKASSGASLPAAVSESNPAIAGAASQAEGAPEDKSWLDFITANILYLGGGLVAILAAVLLLLRRRDSNDEPEFALASAPVAAVGAAAAAAARDDEDLLEVDLPATDDDELLADSLAFEQDQPQKPVVAEPQTDDVVGEADIYIAYGKLDQARAMLVKALEADPDNSTARLKLMEVCAEANDLQAFDEHYALIAGSGDESAVARADDLRMHFDDVPPAAVAGAAALASTGLAAEDFETEDFATDDFAKEDLRAEDLAEPEIDLDVDDWTSLADEPGEQEESAPSEIDELALQLTEEPALELVLDEDAQPEDIEDFDFNLDLDDDPLADEFAALDSISPDNRETQASGAANAEEELDFDFDLEDLDQAADAIDSAAANDLAATDDKFALELDDDEDLEAVLEDEDLDFSLGEVQVNAEAEDVFVDADGNLETVSDTAADEDLEFAVNEPEAEFELNFDNLEGKGDLASEKLFNEPEELSEAEDLDADADADFDLQAEVDNIDMAALDEELGALSGVAGSGDGLADDELASAAELDEEFDLGADFAEFADAEPLAAKPAETGADSVEPDAIATPDPSADSAGAEPELTAESRRPQSDDELFSAALADLPTPEDVLADDEADGEAEDDFDFLADTDETATKLDLARAYIDMGDHEGAKDILDEVAEEGDEQQRQQAEELMSRLG